MIARNFASWRRVCLTAGLVVAVVSVVGVTWALSAPDEALYFARDMAWGGADAGGTHEFQTFPQRTIGTGRAAYQFRQNPSPQLFQTIHYQQDGQPKQANLDDFLTTSQTTALIVIKDGTVIQESYANGYARDSINTSYSVAKSITSAMIGTALGDGYISGVDDPIVAYLPELRGRGLDSVTNRDPLRMSTGHGVRTPGSTAGTPATSAA